MLTGTIATSMLNGNISANKIVGGILKAINNKFQLNLDTGEMKTNILTIIQQIIMGKINMQISNDGIDFFYEENEIPLISFRDGQIGINKVPEHGALDILGDLYVNGVKINNEEITPLDNNTPEIVGEGNE